MAKANLPAAERLRIIMRRKKWNQQALSVVLGVSPAQISRWLAQKRKPSLAWACRIESALGIPVESWRDAA